MSEIPPDARPQRQRDFMNHFEPVFEAFEDGLRDAAAELSLEQLRVALTQVTKLGHEGHYNRGQYEWPVERAIQNMIEWHEENAKESR